MADAPSSITDRIAAGLIRELLPAVNRLTPALIEGVLEAWQNLSDEAKAGLLYAGLHRWLGALLSGGPENAGPLITAMKGAGVLAPLVVETVGTLLASVDRALERHRPNSTSPQAK